VDSDHGVFSFNLWRAHETSEFWGFKEKCSIQHVLFFSEQLETKASLLVYKNVFYEDPIYLQSVVIHSANGGKGKDVL
jgi:hypothetical protein